VRKIGISSAVGVIVAMLSVATVMAGPAYARAGRHHGRHHHHHTPPPPPPPTPPPPPFVGCALSPQPAQIQGAGSSLPGTVLLSVQCQNLTPSISVTVSSQTLAALCQGVAAQVVLNTDNRGNTTGLFVGGNGTTAVCNTGVFTAVISENVSPGRSFFASDRIVA
jgi:hypothetical protein